MVFLIYTYLLILTLYHLICFDILYLHFRDLIRRYPFVMRSIPAGGEPLEDMNEDEESDKELKTVWENANTLDSHPRHFGNLCFFGREWNIVYSI